MRRLGLLSFSDGRDRVHGDLVPDILRHEEKLRTVLESSGEIATTVGQIVHSNDSAREEARRLAALQLDGVIFNIAVFPFPNFVVIATQLLNGVPLLLLGPHEPRYPGLTGLLATAGALEQLGIRHERLWVDLDAPDTTQRLMTFARVAAAATRLRGQVYGLIGGRSIGMTTGAAPAEMWQRQFGVDIDHVDQAELLRQAGEVPCAEVDEARNWFKRHLQEIVFDPVRFTPEKWDFQIRCYVALKNLAAQSGFDFLGLKCHHELSEFHCVQCISAALMNDPYDWHGPKDPVPLACEADSDGALTMQMLRLVSGRPVCLLDLRFFDQQKQVWVMPNCGAAPTWFAARSEDPAENLRRVRLVPAIPKYAGGGGHFEFVFGKGELTLARLTRSPEGYRMFIARGDAVEYKLSDVTGACANWPHAFVRINASPEILVNALHANHLHAIGGDYRAELLGLCRLLGITPAFLANGNPEAHLVRRFT